MSARVGKESNVIKRRGGARPGSGRPKGSIDKGNAMIRELVVQALSEVGGSDYFVRVSESHPAAFMALIGKVMPVQIEGSGGGPVQAVTRIELVGLSGDKRTG